eukprot:CAMPEP_0198544456 /NCGR_PEP_ID=MMETSP1462-20131121/60922_1 /TAXON_ID=1333877 /ORGANISM="Brandtodinium nutriculum, Strain RCC3387" /LENGTH=203 /DNA_ID=CAMNT_0044274795 /DNA_START=29 /DNA_END=638 /DNA_ORIENTATION=+
MAIFAIPGYAAIGWVAPVVAAVFSTLMCAFAVHAMWTTGRDLRQYLSLLPAEDGAATGPSAATRAQTCVAVTFSVVAFAWAALDFAVHSTAIAPAKASQPCGGECGHCAEDPNCASWAEGVRERHPIVDVCPTVKAGSEADTTFSCLADGAWLTCTGLVGLLWLVLLRCRCARCAHAGPKSHGGHVNAQVAAWATSEAGAVPA